MSCTYFHNEIDSMFDNEPNDLNNDTLLSDKLLWTNDTLSMISNDMTWDSIVDDLSCQNFDNDKNKDKFLDFDCHLSEFNDIFEEPSKSIIKMEPTHTNSVSSPYLTDDCSPTSSNNNSPVGRKVKKRDFQAIDSSSEKSFALYDDFAEHHPLKSAKIEASVNQGAPKTIYKFSRNSKLEPREPIIINTITNQRQIVKIRQNPIAAPYIVQRSIKSVNISKYSQEKHGENNNNNIANNNSNNSKSNAFYSGQHYDSPVDSQDCDLLNDNFYDDECDIYDDYKPRVGSYVNVFSNSNSQHHSGSVPNFQTPIPQTGTLYLTDEEKRTLIQENYPIPTRVPLTKQEERNLKKVRRKIKNKLSAQESRRKKKEYVDTLEKKVELYEQREIENKRRIETLENQQRTLQNQIRHYQHQLMNKITGTANTTSTGLMLFMVCFALILVGNSVPSSYRAMNLPKSSLVSRSSLYYMGYGPSRDMLNNSRSLVMASDDILRKPNKHSDRSATVDILPRQSILLGEDGDDKNFEEMIMSYRKSRKSVCDNDQIDSRDDNSMKFNRNSSTYPHSTYPNVHQDMVMIMIARVSNIILAK